MSKHDGRTPIPPSTRRRFVTRAETLVEGLGGDGARFREDLAAKRELWNESRPEYSVHGTGSPPEELPDGPSLPPSLERARRESAQAEAAEVEAARAKALRGGATLSDILIFRARERSLKRGGHTMPQAREGMTVVQVAEVYFRESPFAAADEWHGMVNDLSTEWWPRQFYPNWIGSGKHPADPFVAACLIYNPLEVPTTIISSLRPVLFDAYVSDLASSQYPSGTFWESAFNNIVDSIRNALERGDCLTVEMIDKMRAAACMSGAQATSGADTLQPVIPILPGMTSTDLREMESEVLVYLRHHDHFNDDVRALHRDGMKIAPIARLVGLSRRAVQNILGT